MYDDGVHVYRYISSGTEVEGRNLLEVLNLAESHRQLRSGVGFENLLSSRVYCLSNRLKFCERGRAEDTMNDRARKTQCIH